MADERKLVRVGGKYYLPGTVVPPEEQRAVIREYLEIPSSDYGMVEGILQELDLPGIVLEIYRALDRIYQERISGNR